MDIFWQITVIQSLQNVAVFAVAMIAFGFVRQGVERIKPDCVLLSNAVVGVLLGIATAVTLLMPVHVGGGAATGIEMILLALAGLIAGFVGAGVALIFALAAELACLLHGSALDRMGLMTALTFPAAGVIVRVMLRWRIGSVRISYFHFPLLGAICAGLALFMLWLFQGTPAVLNSAIPGATACILAVSVLGTLMLHESRRHEAEQELRASQARLAAQTDRLVAQAVELSHARDAAEAASQAKSAFLANMSHELRTPLNAILGFSEMMASESFGPLGAQRYVEYAGDINSSGAHLLSLINDLLDVAKIEAGQAEVAARELDVRRTFETALKLVAAKASEKNQALAIAIAPNTPPLIADERAIKQILINLVSNAVKFTPVGGRIEVRAGRAPDGGFELVCEDNGPGMAREKLEKMFKPFSQIDNRYDRAEGGSGLGLALVKGLAELHRGRVWLDSEVGKGCRAHVVLPPDPLHKITEPVAA